MANVERLTKRVKKIEEWVAENEEMGGPKGYLDTMTHMYNSNVQMTQQYNKLNSTFNQLRSFAFEFIKENKLEEEWDAFLEEKEDAVQEQPTEEVPVQEQAESSEKAIEEEE